MVCWSDRPSEFVIFEISLDVKCQASWLLSLGRGTRSPVWYEYFALQEQKSQGGLLIKTQQKETASHMLCKHCTLVQAVFCKANLIWLNVNAEYAKCILFELKSYEMPEGKKKGYLWNKIAVVVSFIVRRKNFNEWFWSNLRLIPRLQWLWSNVFHYNYKYWHASCIQQQKTFQSNWTQPCRS